MTLRQISTGSNILLTHGFELLYAGMLTQKLLRDDAVCNFEYIGIILSNH